MDYGAACIVKLGGDKNRRMWRRAWRWSRPRTERSVSSSACWTSLRSGESSKKGWKARGDGDVMALGRYAQTLGDGRRPWQHGFNTGKRARREGMEDLTNLVKESLGSSRTAVCIKSMLD